MRNDEGSATILTIGLVAVLLGVILTVASATHVHQQRLRLQHVADEVALAAADALDLGGYYGAGGGTGVGVSAARVLEEAEEHLRASSLRQGIDGVRLVAADATAAGVSVTLALTSGVILGSALLPGSVDLSASATADADLG